MKLVRGTESRTVDIQNWRRYGTYVPAGQVIEVQEHEAAVIEQQQIGVALAEAPSDERD